MNGLILAFVYNVTEICVWLYHSKGCFGFHQFSAGRCRLP